MSFRIRIKNKNIENLNTNNANNTNTNTIVNQEKKIIKLEYDTIIYDKNIQKWRIIKQGTVINS